MDSDVESTDRLFRLLAKYCPRNLRGIRDVHESGRPADRAVSEIMGTVLLISLVLFGSAVVIALGAGAIGDAQEQTRTESAIGQFEALDAQLAGLAASDDNQSRVEFSPQNALARDLRLEHSGYINVTVDGNSACSVQQELSTITFEDSQGRTVGYEAGGIWRAGTDGSASVSPPDLTLDDGRLNVELVNLSGHVDQATNRVTLNVSRTRNRTNSISKALRQGDCVRPDNVTVVVNSTFQSGWRNHLAAETGVDVSSSGERQVSVVLEQEDLHPSANDSQNNIVNLRDGLVGVNISYMDSVTLNDTDPPEIGVDKGAGNTYTVYIAPLTNDSLAVSNALNTEGTNVSGPPMDVSFVLDESGSMTRDANSSCSSSCPSKVDAAKRAAKNFTGTVNASKDRIGLVGYDSDSRYILIDDERFFVSDKTKINNTIDSEVSASGTTRIDRGLKKSNVMFGLKSNTSQRKIAVLLSDGENDCGIFICLGADSNTIDQANIAAENDITIFTVGFGPTSDIDEPLMRQVANETGGDYFHAENSSELNEAFQEISDRIRVEEAVATTPLTSNVTSSSGNLFTPEIPGNVDHLANVSRGNDTFLNINDPTAPATFSHSFPLDDGETASLNVTQFDCKPGHFNLTGQSRTVAGSTVSVARCTEIAGVNDTYRGHIYVDGERPDEVLETSYASWQRDINDSLGNFPSVRINSTTGELNTTSNQALVAYDLPPQGPGTRNTLVLLFRIGLAESESRGAGIVNVRVSETDLS